MGYQATVQDEPDLTIPEDTFLRARLEEVSPRTIEWTNREGEHKKREVLQWWWKVTDSGKFNGRKVKGECDARLTNRPGNQFREWAEAILGRSLPVNMTIDVDDLVGMEAEIAVMHSKSKDGSRTYENVVYVITTDQSQDSEPPF